MGRRQHRYHGHRRKVMGSPGIAATRPRGDGTSPPSPASTPWFLDRLQNLIDMERRLLSEDFTPDLLRAAKRRGFSDEMVGRLADRLPEQVREARDRWGSSPSTRWSTPVPPNSTRSTPYFYSTYESENEAEPEPGEATVVVGSGPIRIGQGIEFDYASVHAAWALQKAGRRAILVNSNPETVSTDFDTSDRLYFEPLDEEAIRDLLENEGAGGNKPSSIVQFGGQTAINMAEALRRSANPIIGSDASAIETAEDRGLFERFLQELGIPQPPGAAITNLEDAMKTAQTIGYPVLIRPSFVLGGRAMEIVQKRLRDRYLYGRGGIRRRRPTNPRRQVPRGPRSRGRRDQRW